MVYDATIIGGGFYGCEVAEFLFKKGLKKVIILEKENNLFKEASYINQARIHNGYHYPRDYLTAYRSHVNFKKFIEEYRYSIYADFFQLYAIAKNFSKTTAAQFVNFCKKVGIPLQRANSKFKSLFNPNFIEEVFETEEVAFDAKKLQEIEEEKLRKTEVEISLNTKAIKTVKKEGKFIVFTNKGEIKSKKLFLCAYAGINNFLKKSNFLPLPLKHELTEVVLITPPSEISNLGITVMDGPFFSTMPFPAENCHSLTHVRFTPHKSFGQVFKNEELTKNIESNYDFMINDAVKYVPILHKSRYIRSLYTFKTILISTEENDGRPIIFRGNYVMKDLFIIVGGKIDNIYDIKNRLSQIF